ncbi:MAG: hypothetical protein M1826_003694, partial [Phylliscum demangeonii]
MSKKRRERWAQEEELAEEVTINLQAELAQAVSRGNFQQAKLGHVKFDDDELPSVRRMINYLYKLDYSDECEPQSPSSGDEEAAGDQGTSSTNPAESSALAVNASMYAFADKYQIPGLKVLSKQKFCRTVPVEWNNESFSHVVRVVYEDTMQKDRGLRDLVARVAKDNIQALRGRGEFKSVLSEVHDFTLDLLNLSVDD